MTFGISILSARNNLVAASLIAAGGLFAAGAQANPVGAGLAAHADAALVRVHDQGYGYGRHRRREQRWRAGHHGWDHHADHARHSWGHHHDDWGHQPHRHPHHFHPHPHLHPNGFHDGYGHD